MSDSGKPKNSSENTAEGTDPILEQIYGAVDQTDSKAEVLGSTEESMVDVAALQSKIAELEKDLKETQARANAEIYNFQKRVERETDNVKKFALEKFANSMLDVVDNLERALAAPANEATQAIFDGVTLTHKGMLTALEKHGIAVVNPVGAPFSAEHHQAVGIDPEAAKDVVGKVLQKGYILNGRLLRPAMVMVGG